MTSVEELWKEHRWLFLALCLGFIVAGAVAFLTSFGVIHPSFDTGPRAPRWICVCVSTLLLAGGLGPLVEYFWRSSHGPSRPSTRARMHWDAMLGLLFFLCIAAPANWIVYGHLKDPAGLFSHGPLVGVLLLLGLCALLVFTVCLDAYLAMLTLWLIRSALRSTRPDADSAGRRPA